jgi:hypothetical protein
MSELNLQVMIDSYNNISFSPERRGKQDYDYYSDMLQKDLERLGENQGNYKRKFIERVMLIYYRQSRCASSFICGPANFPVRKAIKANDSLDNAIRDFSHWRKKYFTAVERTPTPSPEEEIEITLKDIDNLVILQERMKETNKVIRKYKLTEDYAFMSRQENWNETEKEAYQELLQLLGSHKNVWEIMQKGHCCGCGFASYSITSVTTKIRERKKKLDIMRVRIERKEKYEPKKFNGGSIYIENDRVIIQHDSKPDKAIIEAIKRKGFRWSPKCGNWCRKHTGNAIYDAENLLKNVFGDELQ